jgi:hypothetical protein
MDNAENINTISHHHGLSEVMNVFCTNSSAD